MNEKKNWTRNLSFFALEAAGFVLESYCRYSVKLNIKTVLETNWMRRIRACFGKLNSLFNFNVVQLANFPQGRESSKQKHSICMQIKLATEIKKMNRWLRHQKWFSMSGNYHALLIICTNNFTFTVQLSKHFKTDAYEMCQPWTFQSNEAERSRTKKYLTKR